MGVLRGISARPAKVVFDRELGSVKWFLLTSSPVLMEGQVSECLVEGQVGYGGVKAKPEGSGLVQL